jgi:protein gp37
MAENSGIEWTDHSFAPWFGCTKISPACDGCYAEAMMDGRWGKAKWGAREPRVRAAESTWKQVRTWDRRAARDGTKPFVFCSHLSDVFDNAVPAEWRRDLFDLMRETPNLIYLVLTKRPINIARMSAAAGGLPANVAIGTTAEDQKRANTHVMDLLEASVQLWRAGTKPLFRFVSVEPMLGPVDLTNLADSEDAEYRTDALIGQVWIKAGTNEFPGTGCIRGDRDYVSLCHDINWVIVGGETDQGDHKARPMNPEWVRSLRDQCAESNIPFFFKQWGQWGPGENIGPATGAQTGAFFYSDGTWSETRFSLEAIEGLHIDDEPDVWRARKKATGRMLDGVIHGQRPELKR